MNVSMKNGVVTIKTGISEDILKKAYGKKLVAKDEKGNDLFVVTTGTNPSLASFGITCNHVVDGDLAYVAVVENGYSKERFLADNGDALLAAKQYLPQISAQVEARAAALEGIVED